jgi:cell division protein FtsQ
MRRREGSLGGAVALTLVLLGAATWAVVTKTPLFDVRDVRVLGVARISPEEIVDLARVAEGSNLLLMSTDQVASSVRSNPWVAEVRVRRELPSTIVVQVRERVPVGWVPGPEGGGVVLAEDGTVVARRARPRALVTVGRMEILPEPGDRVPELRPQLRVVGSLPPHLRGEVARASLQGGEVVLRLRAGPRVLYGRPEGLPAKRAALESLLRWVEQQGIEAAYLDLRAPGTPAVRPVRDEP